MGIYDGRLNRAKYIFWVFIIQVLVWINYLIDMDGEWYSDWRSKFTLWLFTLAMLSVPAIKRFHDLDRHGAYFIYLLIPIINIYFLLLLIFKKGTEGANRFGPDPLMRIEICENCKKEIEINMDEVNEGSFICPACNAVNMLNE